MKYTAEQVYRNFSSPCPNEVVPYVATLAAVSGCSEEVG
jgi:hypothetical protein